MKREDRLLARIAPEPEKQEDEHGGAEVGEPRSNPGTCAELEARQARPRPASQRDVQARPGVRALIRIGTFTVRVYASNSDTRSVSWISQVPPGLSTAELRM